MPLFSNSGQEAQVTFQTPMSFSLAHVAARPLAQVFCEALSDVEPKTKVPRAPRQREPFGERCWLLRLGVTLIAPASQDTRARGMAATWAKLNDIGQGGGCFLCQTK